MCCLKYMTVKARLSADTTCAPEGKVELLQTAVNQQNTCAANSKLPRHFFKVLSKSTADFESTMLSLRTDPFICTYL